MSVMPVKNNSEFNHSVVLFTYLVPLCGVWFFSWNAKEFITYFCLEILFLALCLAYGFYKKISEDPQLNFNTWKYSTEGQKYLFFCFVLILASGLTPLVGFSAIIELTMSILPVLTLSLLVQVILFVKGNLKRNAYTIDTNKPYIHAISLVVAAVVFGDDINHVTPTLFATTLLLVCYVTTLVFYKKFEL